MGHLTLNGLLEKSASEFGLQQALVVSGGPQFTHKELQVAIDNAAAQLRRIGVKPGNLVSLAFPNTLEVCNVLWKLTLNIAHLKKKNCYCRKIGVQSRVCSSLVN